SATPERDDRLFPGDPMQSFTGALNLAHGAAGVLYSLDAVGCGRYPAHEDWLVERALHPRRTPRLGCSDGPHGVAYLVARLGGEHPYAGLILGSSGPALLFIRRYEQTGDDRLLDLAATALRQDLRRCVVRSEGTLEVEEGWRTLPYLARGSVGIGFVLAEYLAHREDEQFSEAAGHIRQAASAHFYIQAGLFAGRAGMILYLCHRRGHEGVPDTVADH